MVEHPVATVRLLHDWLSDLEQWCNTRTSKSCARALLWVGSRESTQRQRLAADSPKFLWAIKPLQSYVCALIQRGSLAPNVGQSFRKWCFKYLFCLLDVMLIFL